MKNDLLTASRMSSLLRCPRAHYWRYEANLRSTTSSDALRFGSAWHRAMEEHAKGVDYAGAFSAGLGNASEIDEQQAATLAGMLAGYYHQNPVGDPNFSVLYPELEFNYSMPNSKTFSLAGKIDGIGKLKDGRLAILEHKTTSESIDSGSDYWLRLRFNGQLLQYVLAARQYGWDISTAIYAVAKKPAIRPKQIPTLDEHGMKIVTCDETGERVFLKTGKPKQTAGEGETLQSSIETPDAFSDRLAADCIARHEFYFARREVPILQDDLDEFVEQRRMIGLSILHYRQASKKFREPCQAWPRNCSEMNCRSCEYQSFCLCNSVPNLENPPDGFEFSEPFEELTTTTKGTIQ